MSECSLLINLPEEAKSHKKNYFVSPLELVFRVWASFVPPLCLGWKYKRIYSDFIGPTLGILLLTIFVQTFHTVKSINSEISAFFMLISFYSLMPVFAFVFCKFAHSFLTLQELFCLIGYSSYGHLITLLTSYVFYHETSNAFFFLCLIFFGGFSTLRMILLILTSIPKPGPRLLVCSLISTLNLIFLVLLHFVFMHASFTYKKL